MDFADRFGIGGIEYADDALGIGDECALALVIESDAGRQGREVHSEVAGRAEIRFPEFRLPVAAGTDRRAIAAEGEGSDASGMSIEFFHLAAAVHFPKSHAAILGGGREEIGIRPEDRGGDGGLMPAQRVELAGARTFPDPHAAVAITAGQQDAIRREVQRGDPVGVLLDGFHQFAGFRVPDFQEPRRSAGGHEVEAGPDVRGEHGVEFLGRAQQAGSGSDVEGDGDAGLPRHAAADDQVASIRGEGE